MKAISKIVAVLAASALAFGMFGCSKDATLETTNADEAKTYTSEEIKASDLVIEQSGYSLVEQTTIDAEGNEVPVPGVNFAFIVRNNNSGYVAENVPFNVNGYNAAGDMVFSGGANCMYVYPGIDTAVSGTTSIGMPAEGEGEPQDTAIAEITVEPLMSTVEWLKVGLSDSEIAGMFTVGESTVERIDGMLNINATVTGDVADADKIYRIVDLEDTLEGHCVAIFYDADGNILFGSDSSNVLIDQEMMDSMKDAGEGGAGNVAMSVQNAPDYADYRIYAMPGL